MSSMSGGWSPPRLPEPSGLPGLSMAVRIVVDLVAAGRWDALGGIVPAGCRWEEVRAAVEEQARGRELLALPENLALILRCSPASDDGGRYRFACPLWSRTGALDLELTGTAARDPNGLWRITSLEAPIQQAQSRCDQGLPRVPPSESASEGDPIPDSVVEPLRRCMDLLAARSWEALEQAAPDSRSAWSDVDRVLEEYGRTYLPVPQDFTRLVYCIRTRDGSYFLECPMWTVQEGRSDLEAQWKATQHPDGSWNLNLQDILVP
ncbi:DUF7668 domain-containing protein [Actinomyces israelii]|uniref:DUF7668 domain-containing protein n=1 Tax=Actinomyces israelii TaxID=1659 RepID=UPI0023542010|nr:hypothetical protein [Actinomyces israelii]